MWRAVAGGIVVVVLDSHPEMMDDLGDEQMSEFEGEKEGQDVKNELTSLKRKLKVLKWGWEREGGQQQERESWKGLRDKDEGNSDWERWDWEEKWWVWG